MATRAELAATLRELQSSPGFRHYVITLQGHRDDTIAKLLKAKSDEVEALRGEANAYDTLLREIFKHTSTQT